MSSSRFADLPPILTSSSSLWPDTDWNPVQFLDADARPLSASDNWMNPGVDFPTGSAVLSASNRVQFASENSYAQIEGVNPTAPFTSEEIVFTGNG